MTCSNCGKDRELYSGIKQGKAYKDLCERCAAMFTPNDGAVHAFNKRADQRKYAKDILQPFDGVNVNPAWVDAYPEQAVNMWGESVRRDYGVDQKLF